jgi:hypothetical protein
MPSEDLLYMELAFQIHYGVEVRDAAVLISDAYLFFFFSDFSWSLAICGNWRTGLLDRGVLDIGRARPRRTRWCWQAREVTWCCDDDKGTSPHGSTEGHEKNKEVSRTQ